MANEFIARNGLIAQNNSTVTGSLEVTQGITGSLLGTASYATQALTASYASTYAPVFPYTGSAIITGSLEVTGSIRALVTGSDFVNIGNAVTASQRLVRIGQDTAFVDIGSLVGSTSAWAIYGNQATPSVGVAALWGGSTTTNLNGPTTVNVTIQTAIGYTMNSFTENLFQQPNLRTSGTGTFMEIRPGVNTNQTLSTNIPNFRVTGANKQWATGTLANQYFNYFTANTASFVGASTATNVYGLFVEAAAAGTNATITNNYAAGFSGRVGQYGLGNSTYFGDLCGVKDDLASRQNTAFGFSAANKVAGGGLNIAIGATALFSNVSGNNNVAIGGLTLYQATSNSNIAVGGYALFNLTNGQNNVAIGYDTGGGVSTGANNIFIGNSITGLSSSLSNNIILATNAGAERFRYNPSQGSPSLFSFSPASTTGNVSSTEINIFRVNAATTTLSTGALTTQRFTYLPSQTLAFAGASTATNVYGLFAEAAIAGTNATITNNYAAGFSGRVNILSDTATIMIGSQVGSTARGAIYINQATPNTTNFALSAHQTAGSTYINGSGGVNILYGGNIQIIYADRLSTFGSGLTHFDFNFSGTNGTKLGTATTQKIGFWNATPIVQPTTAVAAAILVGGGGTTLTDTDTFDGYTLQQIVKALRNTGLLA
jgi:hypothetical protein